MDDESPDGNDHPVIAHADDTPQRRPLRRRRGAWIAVCVVVVLALGALATSTLRSDESDTIGTQAAVSTAAISAPLTTTTSTPAATTTITPPTTTVEPPASTNDLAPAPAPAPDARASGSSEPEPPPPPAPAPVSCVVRLHGKGGAGAPATESNGVTILSPGGNASGWGGRQWLYESAGDYGTARAAVASAIDEVGCTRVNIAGFSNGAAFSAALYCRGETFGGRLGRVIVDDPVTDHAVEGCRPGRNVGVTLYWTGALAGQSQPGWECASADWTCAGGTTIGIERYSAALGIGITQSPMGGHSPYLDPPELYRF